MRVLSTEIQDQVVDLYRRGRTSKEIATDLQISPQTVCNVLHRRGVTVRGKAVPDEKILSAIAMRNQGETLLQIARSLDVSKSTLSRSLKKRKKPKLPSRRQVRQRSWKPTQIIPTPHGFEMASVPMHVVESLCALHHKYRSAGKYTTYAFAVIEDGRPVAAFAWQPPALGGARKACPEAPEAVLALSRMVAVPREERRLRHISKALRYQMKHLIDRTRWPVLVTYADESLGHTGYVYKCSGWQPAERTRCTFYTDDRGRRASIATSDKSDRKKRHLKRGGKTTLRRWEHRVCETGGAREWLHLHGWRKVATNRVLRSGNPAFTWIREPEHHLPP